MPPFLFYLSFFFTTRLFHLLTLCDLPCCSYPIVYFNAMHPGEDIDLASNASLIAIARNTVELVNRYNSWSPTNGMCLAWPSASRVASNATHLLQAFQQAANSTMMNNLLPYIVNHPDSG